MSVGAHQQGVEKNAKHHTRLDHKPEELIWNLNLAHSGKFGPKSKFWVFWTSNFLAFSRVHKLNYELNFELNFPLCSFKQKRLFVLRGSSHTRRGATKDLWHPIKGNTFANASLVVESHSLITCSKTKNRKLRNCLWRQSCFIIYQLSASLVWTKNKLLFLAQHFLNYIHATLERPWANGAANHRWMSSSSMEVAASDKFRAVVLSATVAGQPLHRIVPIMAG